MRIDHVQFAMPPGREDDARAFFSGQLGMDEEIKPKALRGRGGCWFRRGDCVIHVGVDTQFIPQRKAHAAFLVDDIDQTAAALGGGDGITWDDAIPGVRRFYASDPFGNRVEFMQRGQGLSERPATSGG